MYCPNCGFKFVNNICPNCGRTNTEEVEVEEIYEDDNNNGHETPEITIKECPECGAVNVIDTKHCNNCGHFFKEIDIVKDLSRVERKKYFMIGLQLIYKIITIREPKFKKCLRCGKELGTSDERCPECNRPTLLFALKQVFQGNYENTALDLISKLLPEFSIIERTNAAYMPLKQILSIKNDCELIASTLSRKLNTLATFLKSSINTKGAMVGASPVVARIFQNLSDLRGNARTENPAPRPSSQVLDKIRDISDEGPSNPWNRT
jgi:hypothetical protein